MLLSRLVELRLEELFPKTDVDELVDLEGWDRLTRVELAKALTGSGALVGVELDELDAVGFHVLTGLPADAAPLRRIHRNGDAAPSEIPFPFGNVTARRRHRRGRRLVELRALFARFWDRNIVIRGGRRPVAPGPPQVRGPVVPPGLEVALLAEAWWFGRPAGAPLRARIRTKRMPT